MQPVTEENIQQINSLIRKGEIEDAIFAFIEITQDTKFNSIVLAINISYQQYCKNFLGTGKNDGVLEGIIMRFTETLDKFSKEFIKKNEEEKSVTQYDEIFELISLLNYAEQEDLFHDFYPKRYMNLFVIRGNGEIKINWCLHQLITKKKIYAAPISFDFLSGSKLNDFLCSELKIKGDYCEIAINLSQRCTHQFFLISNFGYIIENYKKSNEYKKMIDNFFDFLKQLNALLVAKEKNKIRVVFFFLEKKEKEYSIPVQGLFNCLFAKNSKEETDLDREQISTFFDEWEKNECVKILGFPPIEDISETNLINWLSKRKKPINQLFRKDEDRNLFIQKCKINESLDTKNAVDTHKVKYYCIESVLNNLLNKFNYQCPTYIHSPKLL